MIVVLLALDIRLAWHVKREGRASRARRASLEGKKTRGGRGKKVEVKMTKTWAWSCTVSKKVHSCVMKEKVGSTR